MPEPLEFQVIADLQEIVNELKGITAAQRGLTSAVKESETATGSFTSRLNTMSQALSSARAQTQGLRDMGRSMMMVGAGGAAISASFVTASAKMESLRVGMKAVSGSAAEAEKQMASLKELAKGPAFSVESAIQGSIRLQTAGLSAKQAEEAMRGLASAITVMGKGPAELERATNALKQMADKGKVSQEEINQLAEAGVNVGRLMKEQFQLSSKEMDNLGKAFEARGLTVNEVIMKLTDSLQKKYGPGAKEAADTATNAFTNFSDALFYARDALGTGLLPVVKDALKWSSDFLMSIDKWSPAMKTFVGVSVAGGSGLVTIGGAALNAGANFAMMRMAAKTCGDEIGILGKAGNFLKGAFVFLLTNPYAAAIAGIATAAAYLHNVLTADLAKSLQETNRMLDEGIQKGYFSEKTQRGPERSWFWKQLHPYAYAAEQNALPVTLGPGPKKETTPGKEGPNIDLEALAKHRVAAAEAQLKLVEGTNKELAARQQLILALEDQMRQSDKLTEKDSLLTKIAQEKHDRTKLIKDLEENRLKLADEEARKKAGITDAEIALKMAKDTPGELAAMQRYIEALQNQRAHTQDLEKRERLRVEIADAMADRIAKIRELYKQQAAEAKKAAEEAARIHEKQVEAARVRFDVTYDEAKAQGDTVTMALATLLHMKEIGDEAQRIYQTQGRSLEFERKNSEWVKTRRQYLEDVSKVQDRFTKAQEDAAKKEEQRLEKQRQLTERIGDAVERRIKSEEDAIARKEDRERSVRERAAKWYQDVAQQAANLGNLPMAREFAARGGQLAQEAAGMGVMAGQRDIMRGGEFSSQGLDRMLGAFGQGSFSQADVYAMSRWVEQGVMGAGGPEQRNFTALPTGAIASTLAPQQVVNIFVGEYAIATQADPNQVGQWFQAWYNQQVARQQMSAPR